MSVLDDVNALKAQIEATETVEGSATTFINGVPGLISAAVAAALANGATADQLKPLTDLQSTLQAQTEALSAAIAANTPPPPPPPANP